MRNVNFTAQLAAIAVFSGVFGLALPASADTFTCNTLKFRQVLRTSTMAGPQSGNIEQLRHHDSRAGWFAGLQSELDDGERTGLSG